MTTSIKTIGQSDGGGAEKKWAAYARLKDEMTTGVLAPGSPLPEQELATHFRLSRTPIREILQRLHHDGLVELIPRRGAFVRRLSPEQLIDIFDAREAVEGMAARLAAERHNPERLRSLERTFKHLRIADRPDALGRLVEAGRHLHDFVVEASANGLLQSAYQVFKGQAMLIRSITRRAFAIERASYEDHLRILAALRMRRPEAAEQAMRHHLASTRERTLKQMFGRDVT